MSRLQSNVSSSTSRCPREILSMTIHATAAVFVGGWGKTYGAGCTIIYTTHTHIWGPNTTIFRLSTSPSSSLRAPNPTYLCELGANGVQIVQCPPPGLRLVGNANAESAWRLVRAAVD